MKVYLSSLCSRKKLQFIFKLILIVVLVNFLGYVFILNFNSPTTTIGQNGQNPRPDHQHDYEKKKFEDFVKMQRTKKENVVDDEKDAENENDNDDDEDKKYIDDPKDVPTPQAAALQRRKRYYAIDGNGMASVNTEIVKCDDKEPLEVEVISSSSTLANKADFSYFLNAAHVNPNLNHNNNNNNNEHFHYNMVYAMESEPHSSGGETWSNADFRMWYNLDASFPEPATYFDTRVHLNDLMSAPIVDFDNKEQEASIVWIVSNCNAFNGREVFMKKLMDRMSVHSYGNCLKNKNTHTSEHMKGIGLDFMFS